MFTKIYYYSHTILFRTLAIGIICTIVLMVSFFAWVITGPRSLDYLTPYIARHLAGTHATVHIQHSLIQWDHVKKQIVISAQHVEILDSTNDPLTTIPEISFELNVLRLLLGNFLSSEITVLHPTFYLTTSNKQISVRSQKDMATPRNILDIMRSYLSDEQKTFDITRINLEDASIYIDNGQTNSLWSIKQGFAQVNKSFRKGKRILHAEFSLQSGGNMPTDWRVTLTETKDHALDLSLTTQHLSSAMMQDLFPTLSWLSGIHGVIDGEVHLLSDKDNTDPHVTFQVTKSAGTLHLPNYFPEDIAIKKLTLAGSFSLSKQELTIDSFQFQPDRAHPPTFRFKGRFTHLVPFLLSQKVLPRLDFSVSLDDLAVNDLKKYWPLAVRPLLRDWITTRITGGQITHAEGKFLITPEDIELLEQHEHIAKEDPQDLKDLPLPSPEMIQASIEIDNTNVEYHPKFPVAHHVHSKITFNHKRMNIDITQGTILNSTIKHATVALDNMWLKPSYMTVEGQVEGKAEDMLAYLKATLPEKNIKTPALRSIYHLTGLASGHIELGFPIQPTPLLYDDLNLNLEATLTNTLAPNFIDHAAIEAGSFNVTLHNRSLQVAGKGKIQDIPFSTTYTQDLSLKPANGIVSKNHLQAMVTADQLRALHLADIPYITAPFDLDITLTETLHGTEIKGTADLTKAKLSYPEYNFLKNAGTRAMLTFEGVLNKTLLTLSSFSLKGDHIDIQGNGTISDNILTQVTLPVLKFGRTDASLQYEHIPTGYILDISGTTLDVSNAPLSNIFKQTKVKQSLQLNVHLQELIAKNDIRFHPLTAKVICSPTECQSIDLHSIMEKGSTLDATLQSIDQHHVLLIESNNAGLLINALGISEHIKNGTLHIKTTATKDNQDNLVTQGTIQIDNFNAIQTPLLSKLLTLASLKGFTDILEQQGISFDRFEAPITLSNGIITITDARTSGSSIGITGDGTINTHTNEMDIKGVIVPAQEVNKLISKIPLVGNFIIGGKNQGIIATTYRIEGNYHDAKISVNPFSILTPSFLRKIFTILPDKKN